MKRVFAFIALLALFLLVQAPAWQIDSLLALATSGALRLARIEGTLWDGRGQLVVIDPVSRSVQPWTELQWKWLPGRLFKGEALWRITGDGKPAGDIAVGVTGWRADGLALLAPARFALERVPGTFGHLGWRGDMQLETSQWSCSWKMACTGRGSLRWAGAAVDVLRGRPLGDYLLDVEGDGRRIAFGWSTLSGETKISAKGELAGRSWSLTGDVQGDPAFLQRLPSVAGQWVRQGSGPGHYLFDLRG